MAGAPGRVTVAVGTVGMLALLVAAVLAWWPSVVAPIVDPATVESFVDDGGAVLVVAVALVALLVGLVRSMGTPSGTVDPRGEVTVPAERGLAARFDDHLEAIHETGATSRDGALVAELQRVARSTVAAVDGVPEETAGERVATGAWTDDRIAAATLGDERAPELPLRWRLYRGFLPGVAVRWQVERTVRAIERAADADRPSGAGRSGTVARTGDTAPEDGARADGTHEQSGRDGPVERGGRA